MWTPLRSRNADGRVPVLLALPVLLIDTSSCSGRLLRVLFLRRRALPASSNEFSLTVSARRSSYSSLSEQNCVGATTNGLGYSDTTPSTRPAAAYILTTARLESIIIFAVTLR